MLILITVNRKVKNKFAWDQSQNNFQLQNIKLHNKCFFAAFERLKLRKKGILKKVPKHEEFLWNSH